MVKPKLVDQVLETVWPRHPRLYAKQEGFPTLREVVFRSFMRKQYNQEKNPVHLVYPV